MCSMSWTMLFSANTKIICMITPILSGFKYDIRILVNNIKYLRTRQLVINKGMHDILVTILPIVNQSITQFYVVK